jgi:hypothetical protein
MPGHRQVALWSQYSAKLRRKGTFLLTNSAIFDHDFHVDSLIQNELVDENMLRRAKKI